MQRNTGGKTRRPGYSEAAKQKRATFSQNFIRNIDAAKRVINKANITNTDLVVEIGPGAGALTTLIAEKAAKVIAIEKDAVYGEQLRRQFHDNMGVQIRIQDFMRASLPRDPYIVVANPPFSIFNIVTKKLLFAPNPPEKIILFAQREAAERLTMKNRSYEFGVLTEPWFDYAIIDRFQREDFSPRPNVDVVLLQITKRTVPLSTIVNDHRREYQSFIQYAFTQQGKHVKAALKLIFTYEQWKRICRNLQIPIKVLATQLTTLQWVQLFEAYVQFTPPEKKTVIRRYMGS